MTKQFPRGNIGCAEAEALKAQYLECLAHITTSTGTLREVMRRLLVTTDYRELLRWAKDSGFKDKAVRKVVSQILLELGIRRRKRGAGPEIPQESLAILAWATHQHGLALAIKYLLAAYRAGKRQQGEESSPIRAELKVI